MTILWRAVTIGDCKGGRILYRGYNSKIPKNFKKKTVFLKIVDFFLKQNNIFKIIFLRDENTFFGQFFFYGLD